MIQRPTYSYNENKHLIVFKQEERFQVRDKASSLTEMTMDEQARFTAIARSIKERFKNAVCYAHGSRVNGNFVEDSDYDVAVQGLKLSELVEVRKMFDSSVDVVGVRMKLDFMIDIPTERSALSEMLGMKGNE